MPRVLLLLTPRTYRAQPFLEAIKALGLDVLQGLDMDPELGEAWRVPLPLDFRDPAESVRRIVAAAAGSPIDAVLAVDDSAAVIAAMASQALDIPHNDPDAALAARDKLVMRKRLSDSALLSPRFERCDHVTVARVADSVGFPCVVKPTSLSGSRGVIRADNGVELDAAFHRSMAIARAAAKEGGGSRGAPEPELLVEEFIPGREVAVEGLLTDGKLQVLALFDKPDPLDGPFFEETIYVTPSRLPPASQEAIASTVSDAAGLLGLRHGPIHAELRLNERGAWLLEVAGRSIGGLCSRILRFGTGLSLEELILRHACGLPVTSQRQPGAVGVMMIPIPRAGVLHTVTGLEEARAAPGVEDVQISAARGYQVVPLPEGQSYLGFIFARGAEPEGVEQSLREAHTRLAFDIRPEIPVFGSAGGMV